jgi:hypothetical protein
VEDVTETYDGEIVTVERSGNARVYRCGMCFD